MFPSKNSAHEQRLVIVLSHGGRLANQLWNLSAILAYSFERDYRVIDCSYNQYRTELDAPYPPGPWRNVMRLQSTWGKYREAGARKWPRIDSTLHRIDRAYRATSAALIKAKGGTLIEPEAEIFCLPPTPITVEKYRKCIAIADASRGPIYFRNWLFSNSVGLAKYHDRITAYLRPRAPHLADIARVLEPLRQKFSRVVGVHIRQGDYKTFLHGKFYISPADTRKILEEYLVARALSVKSVAFVIVSDGAVELNAFGALNVFRGPGDPIGDLFCLARCDEILGSNSTFGAYASYYGDVPMVVFQKTPINWPYYADRTRYFEDKYNVLHRLPGAEFYDPSEQFFRP